jgi:hypothetical protein
MPMKPAATATAAAATMYRVGGAFVGGVRVGAREGIAVGVGAGDGEGFAARAVSFQ